MTSHVIETLSVNAVCNAMETTGFIDTYISKHEKEPFWDGHVYLYRNENKVKDCFMGKAYVQVKGKINKKNTVNDTIKYPIEINNLKSYASNGVIFFVVLINESKREAEQIYYVDLQPFKIKRLLTHTSNKRSKSISLKKLPNNYDDIIELIINFINNSNKQQSYINQDIPSIESLRNKDILESLSIEYIGVGNNKNIVSLLQGKEVCLYAKIKHTNFSIPIELIDSFNCVSASCEQHENISIGNNIFFESFIFTQEDRKCSINVNEFFILKEEKLKSHKIKRQITFNLCGTLDERIKQMEFIKALVDSEKFNIGEREISVKFSKKQLEKIRYFEFDNFIKDFTDFKYVLEKLRIKKELDISKCNQNDINNLKTLVYAFKHNTAIYSKKHIDPISYIKIGNISVLLACNQTSEERYELFNFFNNRFGVVAGDEKKPVSQFVILKEKDFLKADNIDYDYLIKDCIEKSNNEIALLNLNHLLLEMIKAYDKQPDKELMEAIKSISNLLIQSPEMFDSKIARINEIQIIARQRKLGFDENTDLYKIVSMDEENDDVTLMMKFCACVLLGETDKAKNYFDKLTEEAQNELSTYPIYHFFEDSKKICSFRET